MKEDLSFLVGSDTLSGQYDLAAMKVSLRGAKVKTLGKCYGVKLALLVVALHVSLMFYLCLIATL